MITIISKLPPELRTDGPARVVLESCNEKLGNLGYTPGKMRPSRSVMGLPVALSRASIQATCCDVCPFKGVPGAPGGCMSQCGIIALQSTKLDLAAVGLSELEVIQFEVDQITLARPLPDQVMRLHDCGDIRTAEEARLLAEDADPAWRAHGARLIYGYTHSWRWIHRSLWRRMSMLASIERYEDLAFAREMGYAPAIVVDEFRYGSAQFPVGDWTITPCLVETRQARSCMDCQLCFDDRLLFKQKIVIAFRVHGKHERYALESLARVHSEPNPYGALYLPKVGLVDVSGAPLKASDGKRRLKVVK